MAGLPNGTIDDNLSFIARIDHAPYDWNKLAYNPTTYGIQAYGKWGRTQGAGCDTDRNARAWRLEHSGDRRA